MYFDGNRMHIIDESTGSGVYNTKGYSGRANNDGSFSYTSDRFDDSNTGPIPPGDYYIKVNEIQTISGRDKALGLVGRGGWPGGTDAWGSQRAWIYAMPGTNTYGRGGFSIHGGAVPGSAGCIDLTGNVNVFFNRLQGAAGSQNQVLLRVRY